MLHASQLLTRKLGTFMQLSPAETHGVGPVRKYSIGAALLDKADSAKVLARTHEPLVRPDPPAR
jgi:hypothetical protein